MLLQFRCRVLRLVTNIYALCAPKTKSKSNTEIIGVLTSSLIISYDFQDSPSSTQLVTAALLQSTPPELALLPSTLVLWLGMVSRSSDRSAPVFCGIATEHAVVILVSLLRGHIGPSPHCRMAFSRYDFQDCPCNAKLRYLKPRCRSLV